MTARKRIVLEAPNCAAHTPCPTGYVAWHEWAAMMAETHRQARCPTCGLYAVWVPK